VQFGLITLCNLLPYSQGAAENSCTVKIGTKNILKKGLMMIVLYKVRVTETGCITGVIMNFNPNIEHANSVSVEEVEKVKKMKVKHSLEL
jgi:hypothetical protein